MDPFRFLRRCLPGKGVGVKNATPWLPIFILNLFYLLGVSERQNERAGEKNIALEQILTLLTSI